MQTYPDYAVKSMALVELMSDGAVAHDGQVIVPTRTYNALVRLTANLYESLNMHMRFRKDEEKRRLKELFGKEV